VSRVACFRVAYALATGRQTLVCLRPLPVMAVAVPPGRLHPSTGFPCEPEEGRLRGDPQESADRIAPVAFAVSGGWQFHRRTCSRAIRLSLAASGHRMSLRYVITTGWWSPAQHGGSCGKLQPLTVEAGQSPLVAITSLRSPTAVDLTRCRGDLSRTWGVVTLSLAFAKSRVITLILADSQAPPWVGASCYARAPWRQTEVCCDPCSLMARTEPPGRHRSSTGPPYESWMCRLLGVSADVGLIRIAPGPFQSQGEPVWGQVREHLDLLWLQFGLAAPGRSYGPLYVTTNAAVAQRRTMVSSRPLNHSG